MVGLVTVQLYLIFLAPWPLPFTGPMAARKSLMVFSVMITETDCAEALLNIAPVRAINRRNSVLRIVPFLLFIFIFRRPSSAGR